MEAQELSGHDAGSCSAQHPVWPLRCLGSSDDNTLLSVVILPWHSRAAPPSAIVEDSSASPLPESHSESRADYIDAGTVDQIDCDVDRTFPKHPFFRGYRDLDNAASGAFW